MVRLGTGDLFALAVDQVFDHEDLVVKPLAPAVMASGVYAGTTLLDDGSPILLLDIQNIADQNGLVSEVRLRRGDPGKGQNCSTAPARPIMLFIGMDGRRRAIGMNLVRRIDVLPADAVDIEGNRAQIVIDGAILPLIGFDQQALEQIAPEGKIKLLRLSDGQCELAYVVSEVSDAGTIENEIVPCEEDRSIEGVTLIGGLPVPIVDGMALFARYGRAEIPRNPLTCRLPADDEWSQTMLRPLVEAAGYRIINSSDNAANDAADVTFVMDQAAAVPDDSGIIIRIHSNENAPASPESGIYRYDREALLSALVDARVGTK